MTEVEIKDAQIADLKKTLKERSETITHLLKSQDNLLDKISIYKDNIELLNKVLDKTRDY